MNPVYLERLLLDGAVVSTGFGVLVLLSLYVNSRIWIQDFPAPLRAALAPLSQRERWQRGIFAVLIIGFLIGGMLGSTWLLRSQLGGSLSFGAAWLHLYILFTLGNLWDTLIVDWLVIMVLRPRWVIPPGAEHLVHLFPTPRQLPKDFVKGLIIGLVFCLPLAWIATL